MEAKKVEIKYNDLMDLLKKYDEDILKIGETTEIIVTDDKGQIVGKFILGNGN